MMLLGCAVAAASAGRRARCRQECDQAIADCVSTTGKRLTTCRTRTLRRCRHLGLSACVVTTSTLPPRCDVDCGSYCCERAYPVCSDTGDGCCRPGYSIYCGNGRCCPQDYPVCGDDDECHKRGGYVVLLYEGGTKTTDAQPLATFTFSVVLSASAQNAEVIALSEASFSAIDELDNRYPADAAE